MHKVCPLLGGKKGPTSDKEAVEILQCLQFAPKDKVVKEKAVKQGLVTKQQAVEIAASAIASRRSFDCEAVAQGVMSEAQVISACLLAVSQINPTPTDDQYRLSLCRRVMSDACVAKAAIPSSRRAGPNMQGGISARTHPGLQRPSRQETTYTTTRCP